MTQRSTDTDDDPGSDDPGSDILEAALAAYRSQPSPLPSRDDRSDEDADSLLEEAQASYREAAPCPNVTPLQHFPLSERPAAPAFPTEEERRQLSSEPGMYAAYISEGPASPPPPGE